MSIRKRIFIPMMALTAGCCIVVLASSILIYSLEIETMTSDKINVASMVVEHEIANLKGNARNAAIAMAHNPNLIEALTGNNREKVINTANALQTLTQVDYFTILDNKGLVLARTHEPDVYGDSLAHLPHVMQALAGNIETYVAQGVTIRFGAYAGAPIYDKNKNMVGVVSLGYRLDAQEFIYKLKAITGCEISVFLYDELISTTVLSEDEIHMPGLRTVRDVSAKELGVESYANGSKLWGREAVKKIVLIKGVDDGVVGRFGVIYYTADEADKILFFIVSGTLITLAVLGACIIISRFIYGFIERQQDDMMNEIRAADETARRAIEEKNMLINLGNIMNGLDAMIYATDPKTGEILFINDCMKRHYGLEGDCIGQLCYKVLQKDLEGKCDFCPCLQLDKEPDKVVVWEEYSSLTNRTYRNVDRYIDWPNGQKVHLQHSVDATELVAAKESAEQTSRYKSAFLASMSHEIRTPMNAILGIAELQLLDKNLSPEAKDAFSKIYESGDLLLNIINDILDFSKIEAGKLELLPVKYDIPSLIHDTAQINLLRLESKPITFSLRVDKDTPHDFYGDELRIKQILNNILSNAFKYTDKGVIELSVSAESYQGDGSEDVTLVFRVSDTGQGMTEAQTDSLFDEYSRFNIEANRTTVGTGLGMSIAKRLVDLMSGDISVESELNKGSVFTVRLPQKRISSAVCGPDLADKLRDFNFNHAVATKKLRFFREYMPYGSVLVVDDVESNLYVTEGMLRPYGLKVEVASNGFEAIEKIKRGKVYDIVFMDHMMPKMDGIEATKIIRAMGYKHSIVALTANALIGRAEMFLQNGFDGYISKPIDSREMNILLNDFIRDKQATEVVEAARREQGGKEPVNREFTVQKTKGTSEVEKFFVLDAEEATKILGNLYGKIHDLDKAEMEKFIVTVNGMKRALSNIGDKELSGAALKLEKAGEERNFTILASETSEFINALESLIMKFKAA